MGESSTSAQFLLPFDWRGAPVEVFFFHLVVSFDPKFQNKIDRHDGKLKENSRSICYWIWDKGREEEKTSVANMTAPLLLHYDEASQPIKRLVLTVSCT